jgi:hypothetical protein
MSVLKRQREARKAEKAAMKRERRERRESSEAKVASKEDLEAYGSVSEPEDVPEES